MAFLPPGFLEVVEGEKHPSSFLFLPPKLRRETLGKRALFMGPAFVDKYSGRLSSVTALFFRACGVGCAAASGRFQADSSCSGGSSLSAMKRVFALCLEHERVCNMMLGESKAGDWVGGRKRSWGL